MTKENEMRVTLEEVLVFREERVLEQTRLRTAHALPVLSFCMNIPGEVKTNDRIRRAFEAGKDTLLRRLAEEGITVAEELERNERTGDAWIAAVRTSAEELKQITTEIEESHPYGRLFDMDVLDTKGEKLSRKEPRRCLVCGGPVTACARSRRHTLAQLTEAVDRILDSEAADRQ